MNNQQTNILAELEQFETNAINIAKIIAGYHEELIKLKVPPTVARELTVGFSDNLWGIALSRSKL